MNFFSASGSGAGNTQTVFGRDVPDTFAVKDKDGLASPAAILISNFFSKSIFIFEKRE